MYWPDDEDEDFPYDSSWRVWAITFYGHIPRYDKESEGGLALKADGILSGIEWRFPKVMAEGWKAILYANKTPLIEIDLSEEAYGRAELEERLVLMVGSTISARIFFAHGDSDFVPMTVANHTYGQGYSITVNGMQQGDDNIVVEGDIPNLKKKNEGEDEDFSQWQLDMV